MPLCHYSASRLYINGVCLCGDGAWAGALIMPILSVLSRFDYQDRISKGFSLYQRLSSIFL